MIVKPDIDFTGATDLLLSFEIFLKDWATKKILFVFGCTKYIRHIEVSVQMVVKESICVRIKIVHI